MNFDRNRSSAGTHREKTKLLWKQWVSRLLQEGETGQPRSLTRIRQTPDYSIAGSTIFSGSKMTRRSPASTWPMSNNS